MIIISMLISLSMFLWLPMFRPSGFTQTTGSDVMASAGSPLKHSVPDQVVRKDSFGERKDSAILSRLKNTRIVFKDGSIRKGCKVQEIHDYWIVYEKGGSLHDLMIEKIRRIEICDGTMQSVFFDDKNKPEIRTEQNK